MRRWPWKLVRKDEMVERGYAHDAVVNSREQEQLGRQNHERVMIYVRMVLQAAGDDALVLHDQEQRGGRREFQVIMDPEWWEQNGPKYWEEIRRVRNAAYPKRQRRR